MTTCTFARIFVPQAALDEWSVGEQILLQGEFLVFEREGWRYSLASAIHVEKCASGADNRGLLGKVKREEDLRNAGAEVYLGSVVWGDDAYEGSSGFLAERADLSHDTQPTPTKDVEMLTKFVLEKL